MIFQLFVPACQVEGNGEVLKFEGALAIAQDRNTAESPAGRLFRQGILFRGKS